MNEEIRELPGVDTFKDLYYKLKDRIQEDYDIHTRDITELLEKYLHDKIKHGELINIAIRGEPGTGKSVVMQELKRRANKILEKKERKKIDEYKTIASDQNEFLRLAKLKENMNTCVGIDEYNPMGRTGANATTEEAEFEFFSDLCRIYYIHRISCSPTRIIDPNINIILDITSPDKEKKVTHAKIIFYNPLERKMIALGSVWIDVKETLESESYKKYEKKKMMRVDLLNKHGVRDVRELEFADVAVHTIRKITPLIPAINKQDIKGLCILEALNYMQEKYKRPISYIAEEEILKRPMIILYNLKTLTKIQDVNITQLMKEQISKTYNKLKFHQELLNNYMNIE